MNAGTIQLPPGLRKVPTGALTVVCVKCTRYGIFQSDDQMLARQDAEAAGREAARAALGQEEEDEG